MTKTNVSPARAQRRRTAGSRLDNTDVRSGIWVVHTMHDCKRVALLGDLRHEHFYFTEGDPCVDSAEYDPPPVCTTLDRAGEPPVRFDAVVTRTDGGRECRLVVSERWNAEVAGDHDRLERHHAASRRLSGTFVQVAAVELEAHRVRVTNWPRVIGAYMRCRHRSLAVVEAATMAALPRNEEITIQDVLTKVSYEPMAIVVASIASLLRSRRIVSDLDRQTWGRFTRLKVVTP